MYFILVGVGGAMGSVVRLGMGSFLSKKFGSAFPIATFIINALGAFLLGVVNGLNLSANSYLLFGDGFLGGYTTFSSFMYESVRLCEKNRQKSAVLYVAISLCSGVANYFAGLGIVHFLLR